MKDNTLTKTAKRPAWHHLLTEGRAGLEFGMTTLLMPFLMQAPKGDGHPVLVLPGFLASDISTRPLRTFLTLKGYSAEGWKLGRNMGGDIIGGHQVLSDRLIDRFLSMALTHQKKVSLVGWSLGGILARELARIAPDYVRQVITLGSPFNGPQGTAPLAASLFKLFNGDKSAQEPKAMRRMLTPPPVPCSAIFSRSDGIAHWQACIDDQHKQHNNAENIEVKGSHIGLGHNPQVIWIIANRLAQAEHQWSPFRQKVLHRALFPNPQRV